MQTALAADPVKTAITGDLAGKVKEMCGVERSSSGGLAEERLEYVGQSWDCTQVENDREAREMRWTGSRMAR